MNLVFDDDGSSPRAGRRRAAEVDPVPRAVDEVPDASSSLVALPAELQGPPRAVPSDRLSLGQRPR
jgi:hypothetical protein